MVHDKDGRGRTCMLIILFSALLLDGATDGLGDL